MAPAYRGRFAPSPTGPLHFGSLLAALASFLDARHHGGQWRVRMEDLDRAREVPGAADDILRTLERLHLHWDGPVLYQSQRDPYYQSALDALTDQGRVYPCACTRKEIAEHGLPGPNGPIYPGTCRQGLPPGRRARALRIRTDERPISFHDHIQGPQKYILTQDSGDFVLRRADGLFAYQLAVVMDDAAQGITHIVRGRDLLRSTPRQILLQQRLGLVTPHYAHLPLALNAAGQKLSKQTFAPAIHGSEPLPILARALQFLAQPLPPDWQGADLERLLTWAAAHWSLEVIPRQDSVPMDAP